MSTAVVESKDTYAIRMIQEHAELIEHWTRAVQAGSQEGFDNDLRDFDVPHAHQIDITGLGIEGLSYVGGLDISFVSEAEDDAEEVEGTRGSRQEAATGVEVPDAYATLVVVEYPTLELRHTITHAIHMDVPYIPTFLSYREAPAYSNLIAALRTKLDEEELQDQFPQVFLVDGNGRLHIRETGVASVVGVQANVPTIGVAKNFLPHHPDSLPPDLKPSASGHWRSTQHGMREMTRHILLYHGSWFGLYNPIRDAYAGAALIPPTSKTPLFVSPGHRISLDTAMRVTLAMGKYKIPEPVRLADKISRLAAASSRPGS
ncbi:endonuclease V [Calocera viscosa TUFC12733]|uniref:Endonuclease V n=1 Tax=Calocera viscosa (strain TUFC12733) TaxID=1330018 RepID=A0A167JD93_CALVF|nr:endonuclease V [Calocera viscosa TUFC12733]